MRVALQGHKVAFAAACSVILALTACSAQPAGGAAARMAGAPMPLSPQPEALVPGLAVSYFALNTYATAEVLGTAFSRTGERGADIATIDFPDRGPGAEVMGSKRSERTGALIEGLIRFDIAGPYTFAMVVNDVAQLTIGGEMLIRKDWDGTGSLMLPPVSATIGAAGWYAFQLVYYQRAGTAALQLFWSKPGAAGGLEIVPAAAFAHAPAPVAKAESGQPRGFSMEARAP